MKKYTSVAGLAMKLTWLRTVLIFAAVGVAQILAARSWVMPSGTPLATACGFEQVADAILPYGCIGFLALALALTFSGGEFKKARFQYTLRRLGIGESRVDMVFAAVFAGYFFLFWVYQLAMVLGLFRWYDGIYAPGQNALMLAAWRSDWFHLLLPLQETGGYLRNIVICLSFAVCAALGANRMRNRKNYAVAFLPPVIAASFISSAAPGMAVADTVEIVLLLVSTVIAVIVVRGGAKDEEVL